MSKDMDEYLQPTFCVYVITYPSHNLNAGMANNCYNNRSQVGKNSWDLPWSGKTSS